jgi:hypothetical protein
MMMMTMYDGLNSNKRQGKRNRGVGNASHGETEL